MREKSEIDSPEMLDKISGMKFTDYSHKQLRAYLKDRCMVAWTEGETIVRGDRRGEKIGNFIRRWQDEGQVRIYSAGSQLSSVWVD